VSILTTINITFTRILYTFREENKTNMNIKYLYVHIYWIFW